jgi:hypothetical protein
MVMIEGAAKAAARTLVRRVNRDNPSKQTGDVRTGSVRMFCRVDYLGAQSGFGGEVFSVSRYAKDRRDWDFNRQMTMYVVRDRSGKFAPLSFEERRGRRMEYTPGYRLKGDTVEFLPGIQQAMASVAAAWFPAILSHRR